MWTHWVGKGSGDVKSRDCSAAGTINQSARRNSRSPTLITVTVAAPIRIVRRYSGIVRSFLNAEWRKRDFAPNSSFWILHSQLARGLEHVAHQHHIGHWPGAAR